MSRQLSRPLACLGVSCLALIIAAPALAGDIAAASKIDAVTVFPDAAGVTRVAEVNLPQGASTIVFKGLPIGLDPNSLRVSGEGAVKLTIGTVEQRIAPSESPPADDSLEAKIKSLEEQRAQLQVTLEALERRRAMIVRFSEAGPEKLSPEAKPLEIEKWTAAWDAVGDAMKKVGEDLRAARLKARGLDDEIRNLRASRARPEPGRGPARDVIVTIEADAAGTARLTLKYRVGGASWRPLYDARLDTGGDAKRPAIEFVRRAAITQRTGEDWSDVSLSVSTVRTDRGTQAPDIQPLVVAFPPPPPVEPDYDAAPRAGGRSYYRKRSFALPPPPAPAALAKPKAADEAVMPAREASAGLEANAYQASFRVAGRISVPANGAQKAFQLGSKTIEPTLLVKTVPSLDPTAYLDAAFTNADEAPLLPGDVALVRDGTFVGSGHIDLVAPGDKVDLGFGADDRVKVVRVPVRRRENDPVWVGGTKIETNEFKTTVKNLHDFPVRVTILDQMPVSETTTIIVDRLPTTTPPTEKIVSDKRGVMGWTYDIAPGATKEVRIGWRTRWPSDSQVMMTTVPVQPH